MSYINNPDITKEDILKKSLAHWNVGKTQEWIDKMCIRDSPSDYYEITAELDMQ